jgi:hypothetical protein
MDIFIYVFFLAFHVALSNWYGKLRFWLHLLI